MSARVDLETRCRQGVAERDWEGWRGLGLNRGEIRRHVLREIRRRLGTQAQIHEAWTTNWAGRHLMSRYGS